MEITSQLRATAALQILLPRKPLPPQTTSFRFAEAEAAADAMLLDSTQRLPTLLSVFMKLKFARVNVTLTSVRGCEVGDTAVYLQQMRFTHN